MSYNYKSFIAIAGIFILTVNLYAQDKPLPLDPAVRTGKLTNGFTYYIRHNEEPKNRALFYLANNVGSVLENDDQQGLAHFMEHMSFNGTTHFPKNQLVNYLQKAGVRFGADLNAHTSFNETVYQLPLPTDNPELLQAGIQIMRDWAQEATLDPAEIDKERGIVLEEKRLGKGASERMQRQYMHLLLNDSRYAQREPIGLEEIIRNFKPATIRAFYHDWYRPDLQALIVVGDVNVDQMEQIIKAKFSDLKSPSKEKVRPQYTIQLDGRNHFIKVTDKETTNTTAEIYIKHKRSPVNTESLYRNDIAIRLFDQMIGARFQELLGSAIPPFIQGNAIITNFSEGVDCFDAKLIAKPNELESGFKALWREVERINRFGFTSTELDRAKQSYLNNMASVLREKSKTNSQNYASEYLENFLKGEAAPGIEAEYRLALAALPQITLNEMTRLIHTYIRNDNRDILILAPEKDKANLPDEATFSIWLRSVEAETLKPYKDDVSGNPLLAREPVAGKIVKAEKNDTLNITTLTLSNGAKILLKPTEFKDNEIIFSSFSSGGTSLYPDSDYQNASGSCSVIGSFGAGNYSAKQLDKYLSGKQLYVQPYIGETNQGIFGTSSPKDLETALKLAHAYLTEPRIDKEQFSNIIQRSEAKLVNRKNSPGTVLTDTVSAILSNNDIRHTAPSLAKLKQLNLNRIYNIYKDLFADASGMTYVFVGNLDVETIKPLLEKYIASLPSTYSHQRSKDLGIRTPTGRIEKNIYMGLEPKAAVRLFFNGDFAYSAQEKQQLEALKETLQIRLLERLREDESGVYSPGTFLNTSKVPYSHYDFRISFGCAPQNVDKLIASALDEVNKLKTVGPLQVNIDKYKAESQRAREITIKTNRWWLNYLGNQLQDNEPLGEWEKYDTNQQAVTQESLKKTAQKYLNGENYIRIVLLPETLSK